MDYRQIYREAQAENRYIEHIAGDITEFRYPHMAKWKGCFDFNEKMQLFEFEGSDDELREIASEDITVYEFITTQAKAIHLSDMLGCPVSEESKCSAMQAVADSYASRKELFSDAEVSIVKASEFVLRDDFAYIGRLYEEYMDIPIHVVKMKGKGFPFGSVLKGTNIIITDQNGYDLGHDVLHMLYHLKEGINGPDNDNLYVKELWAEVPQLYALQLAEGRLKRRMRLRPSPHPIHFTDYIYLRAYLGQAFSDPGKGDRPHPVYSYIEPSVSLIFSALSDMSASERIRIIAEAILCDKTEELVSAFDDRFGIGSFQHIYDNYSLYDKYRFALDHLDRDLLDSIAFSDRPVMETGTDGRAVKEHWRKAVYENTVVLPAGIV